MTTTNVTPSGRITYLDNLKAFTIFSVVLGHAIQYYDTTGIMGGVYGAIYSFHMPLFMVISGFFLSKLLVMRIDKVVVRKARQLLLPVLSFSLLALCVSLLTPFDILGGHTFGQYLLGGDMWFLKYLFACIVMACVSKLIFCNTVVAALVPAIVLISVSRVGIFRIYPFLWLGFCLNHYDYLIKRCVKVLLPLSFLLFVISLLFWNVEYDYPHYRWITVKDGVTFDWQDMAIVAYRFWIGATGSLFFITLFRLLGGNTHITKVVGIRTLGIYCLQIYLLEHLSDYLPKPDFVGVASVTFVILVAVVETVVCCGVTMLLERNKYLAFCFLGKKQEKRKD